MIGSVGDDGMMGGSMGSSRMVLGGVYHPMVMENIAVTVCELGNGTCSNLVR